ncbi:hypothetical protein QFZ68_005534 [Streptomyces sp. V1I6]|nr:hypothetical protein [Streptomyces sp. V1I6]
MAFAWVGYSSAQRPVMKTVEGTFKVRRASIRAGLSNRSPRSARGP